MKVEFSLINSLGQEFALNNVKTGIMTNIGGLGGKLNNTYAQISDTWILMSSKGTQMTVSGEVAFHNANVYEKEALFTAFLRSSDGLKLKVKTPATTKYASVDVTSYELTAIGNGTLLCPIEMVLTSLWYTSAAQRAIISTVTGNETRYSYRFSARFNDYSNGYLELNNDGSTEASFDVEIYGGIVNPKIAIEVNGVETKSVSITASLASTDRIIYSSKDGNIYCYKGTAAQVAKFKEDGDTTGMTNLALSFSLSNENFFKFPIGNSKLHITADSTLTNPIIVTVYKYYRTL